MKKFICSAIIAATLSFPLAAQAKIHTFIYKIDAISQTGRNTVAVWATTKCGSDRPLVHSKFLVGKDKKFLASTSNWECNRKIKFLAPGTIWKYKAPSITVRGKNVDGRWSSRSIPSVWMNRAGFPVSPPANAASISNPTAMVTGVWEDRVISSQAGVSSGVVPVTYVNLRLSCNGTGDRYEFNFPGQRTGFSSACNYTFRLRFENVRASSLDYSRLRWGTITAIGSRGDRVTQTARLVQ